MQVNEADERKWFSIEEIDLTGPTGAMQIQGEQVRKAFLPTSRDVYLLTYQ